MRRQLCQAVRCIPNDNLVLPFPVPGSLYRAGALPALPGDSAGSAGCRQRSGPSARLDRTHPAHQNGEWATAEGRAVSPGAERTERTARRTAGAGCVEIN